MSNGDRFAARDEDIQQPSSCGLCVHKKLGAAACAAYPQGIPREILSGEVGHTEPYPGDNGIQFESLRI